MIQCFKTSKHGTKSLKPLGPKNKNHLSKCQLFIHSKNISKLGLGRNEDAMSLHREDAIFSMQIFIKILYNLL